MGEERWRCTQRAPGPVAPLADAAFKALLVICGSFRSGLDMIVFSFMFFLWHKSNYGSDSKHSQWAATKLGRGRALQVICPKNGILAILLCLFPSGRNGQKVQHIQFILRETRRGWFLLKNFALSLENILSRVEPRCFLRLPGCISVLSEKYIKAICWDKNYTGLGIWSLRSEIWLFNFLATAELPSSQHSNERQMRNVMTTL